MTTYSIQREMIYSEHRDNLSSLKHEVGYMSKV